MKPIRLLALVTMLAALVGCAHVPSTNVVFNPKTGAVTLQSPKDVSLTNLTATIDGSKVTVSIGALNSKNSADVISAVAAANAQMAQILGQIALKTIQQGATTVGSGGLIGFDSVPAQDNTFAITK